jgi:hypothetical protein
MNGVVVVTRPYIHIVVVVAFFMASSGVASGDAEPSEQVILKLTLSDHESGSAEYVVLDPLADYCDLLCSVQFVVLALFAPDHRKHDVLRWMNDEAFGTTADATITVDVCVQVRF